MDIATPNNLHAEAAIAAAQAGKHIICEKPLARTSQEAKAMYEAAKGAGIVHMVAFNYRRTPAVALAKKYIEEGPLTESSVSVGPTSRTGALTPTRRFRGASRSPSQAPAPWGTSPPMRSTWRGIWWARLPPSTRS